ncbi:MAG: mannitol dehydrogenase family protein, partial [Solobacterium sp.]|nr:mannitol dehydrogenase family protein [Solobacterium sp.]
MELNQKSIIENKQEWLDKGYNLPEYDRAQIIANTKERPVWVHFGAGNIFRAFQAAAVQRMLNQGDMDTGIVAVDGFDYEIISKKYRP